ncbi:MAG: hypothetical protein KJ767_00420 [Nanoarchaeota archaeon]|nr:hypothetical protein [Nanoarchaeota archaeon]
MVRTKKQRAKALEKGIDSLEKNIGLHKRKLEQALQERDDILIEYTMKEIKTFGIEKEKKLKQLKKLKS